MEPVLGIALCWALFGGSHIGLGHPRIRRVLVHRLGEWGFILTFSGVAAVSFSLLVHTYAVSASEGAAGLALAGVPVVRWACIGAISLGFALIAGSLAVYPRSPMALVSRGNFSPRGLERVTRHPFFVGVALLGLAHALMATQLVGTVFFGVLGAFAWLGAWQQDRKLLALRGRSYADYLAVTSGLPFAAILSGRQSLTWRELPWLALGLGLVLAYGLRSVHSGILGHGGVWVIGAVLGGAAFALVQSWRRARRPLAEDTLSGASA